MKYVKLLGTLRSSLIVYDKGIPLKSDWLYHIEACTEHINFMQFSLLLTKNKLLKEEPQEESYFKCNGFLVVLFRSRYYSLSIKWRAPLKVLLCMLQCGTTGRRGAYQSRNFVRRTICIPNNSCCEGRVAGTNTQHHF